MPFTPAHVAAVLPFARRPWIFPALVAGSVAPDMPYFARTLPVTVTAQSWYEPFLNATTSHSIAGVVAVALPYALLLTALWLAARRPLTSLLTTRSAHRPAPAGAGPQRASRLVPRCGWLLASALLGIATHLAWDGLTQSTRLVQHLSTAIGLLILIAVLLRQRIRLRPFAVGALMIVGGLAALAGAVAQRRTDSGSTLEHLLRAGAEAAGLTLGITLSVLIAGWWVRRVLAASPQSS